MKSLNLSSYNTVTKVLWFTMIALAVPTILYSVLNVFSFSLKQWLIFFVTGIICAIISQYQFRLPQTKGYVNLREIPIFWSMIWLGVGGGVLLAVIASVGNFRIGVKNKFRWIFDISLITATTFITGNLIYSSLWGIFGFGKVPIADNRINALALLGAMVIGGFVHYILYSGLYTFLLKLEGSYSVIKLWKDNALLGALCGFFCVFAVFGFHLLTIYFGVVFGLIVLPLVIMWHVALNFHKKLLMQKTKEIREAGRIQLATVEALATAIDARDQVGRGHVRRTQIYAVGIGKMMNLSNDELEALNAGALLHDIGKLAVPDHILNKPGKLTPAEAEKMKIHSAVGASILDQIDFPYPVVSTVHHHHERWDGNGYPDMLGKDEIPITARILAVADTYDTLREARPYRPAFPRDNARKFMLNEAGKQFDPRIVDVLLRNLRVFEEEIEQQDLQYLSDIENDAIKDTGPAYVEQIKLANREAFTLYELAKVFGSSLDLDSTLSLFVKKISEFVPFDTCAVYLVNETESVAIAKEVGGKNREALKNRKVQIGQGATGYALQKLVPVYDIDPSLDFASYKMDFTQEYTAMASLPLIANEKLLGAVSVYSTEFNIYEEEHMRLLETVSRIASDAILTSLRHEETESKALTDPMTNLPNARSLQMQFETEIARARRNGSNFQILMLDLDGFKKVNDTFGHEVGDRLLKEISMVMKRELREYDFLARYAGDEFVAIIPETDRKSIIELCQRLEKAVREHKVHTGDGRFAHVGVSLGAASYPNSGDTLDKIIIAADKAMYAVKTRRKANLRQRKEKELERQRKQRELEARKQREIKMRELRESQKAAVIEEVEEVQTIQVEAENIIEPNLLEVGEDNLIVELDETSIVSSKAIN